MLIVLLLSVVCTYYAAEYILCVDGGGSKTALQIVDMHGVVLPLTKGGVTTDKIQATGSNMNVIGVDGVRHVFHNLIDDIIIEGDKNLRDMLPTCHVVAGMTGTGGTNSNVISTLFEELGIDKNNVLVMPDAALALELVDGDGAILIAGTGSICLGKKGNEQYRVGGLGYLLGDEGSGYAIGLQTIRAALAYEYGWGKPTRLTEQLCKLYGVSPLKEIMKLIYTDKTMSVHNIARAVPIVVAQALDGDEQAIAIINNAAMQLSDLVVTMITIADLSDCEVHLWGGVFKSDAADIIIKTIEQHPLVQQRHITLVNQAWRNATTRFVQQNMHIVQKNTQ